MKKLNVLMMLTALFAISLGACTSSNKESKQEEEPVSSQATTSEKDKSSKEKSSSVDEGPKRAVKDLSISLGNFNNKAYITVRGTQENYTADEFKWAWGLKASDGTFVDGKAKPEDADFVKVDFDSNNQFTVQYCLTDIAAMKSGTLYRIYGGTKETYGDIPFASNQFGASDATRKYYLRQDEDNSLVFDSIQPISFTKASVVEIAQADLPEGIANPGAYVKFGGANSKSLTMEDINSWFTAGNIAGNFQRVIGSGYSIHNHTEDELFCKIEGSEVYFYAYVGFIEESEGWMVHFDLVSGNSNAGLQMSATFNGETSYTVGEAKYRVYADKNKGGEENYWGCLGVFREA